MLIAYISIQDLRSLQQFWEAGTPHRCRSLTKVPQLVMLVPPKNLSPILFPELLFRAPGTMIGAQVANLYSTYSLGCGMHAQFEPLPLCAIGISKVSTLTRVS